MKTSNSASLPNEYRRLMVRAMQRVRPVRRMRQALVLMLIGALLLTSLPVIERLTPAAQAQIVQRICDPTQPGASNQIFQKCAIGDQVGGIEGQLENEALNGLLNLHNLPAGDRGRLVNWERNKVRAALFDKLSAAIQKAPAQRTATEQGYVTAMTNLVKQRRVLSATEAINEYNKWTQTCPYIPPPGFNYNSGTCESAPFIRLPPTFEAFQAYGAARANSELQNDLAQQLALNQTAKHLGILAGYAGIAIATGIAAAIGATLVTVSTVIVAGVAKTTIAVTSLVIAIFPFAAKTVTGTVLFPASVGVGSIAAPVAMFLFAIVTGVIVGIAVFEAEEIPGKLQEAKDRAMNETPDLAQLLSTDAGRREIFGEFMQATFPEFPAAGSAPAAQASDLKFRLTPGGNVVPTLQYRDWDDDVHTVRLSDGWFVDRKGSEAERMTLGIDFKDWTGRRWTATRRGAEFWMAPNSDDSVQPVNTEEAFKSLELQYLDSNNAPQTAMIENSAPAISTLAVTRRQHPPVPDSALALFPNANVSQIATVNDLEDAEESLSVTVTSANPSKGITLSALRVEADGKVFARVQPSCSAVVGNTEFTLEVRDSLARTTASTLNVTVEVNQLPVLSYPEQTYAPAGGSLVINPATGPSDDGGALGQLLLDGSPSLRVGEIFVAPVVQGAPAFTGTLQVSPTTAGVSVQNAGPAGSYFVATSMIDACGQVTSALFTLNVITCSTISVGTDPTNPSCNGATNGRITVNASGGNGTLRYSRDGGQTFQDSNVFDGLSAGFYPIVVRDGYNCASMPSAVILISPQPVTFTTAPVNPTCNGAGNGQITVNAGGGTGALMYSRDNGASFQSSNVFNGLSAGAYQIVVRDANGCAANVQNVTLIQPAAITFTTAPDHLTCHGATDGKLTINANGGTGDLQYSINGGVNFVSANVFNGLAAGNYSVVVKDANGCSTVSQGVTLTQPEPLSLTPTGLSAAQTGAAFSRSFTANGGTGAKTISLNGALPSGVAFNNGTLAGTPLQTGSFPLTLTVTDQNNCTLTQNLTLTVTCSTVAFAPANLPNGESGAAYNATLTALPAGGDYSFAVTSGQLPVGLSLSAGGQISGTPAQNGVYSFRVTATGTGGFAACSGFHDYQININGCAPITVGPATLNAATVGAPFNQTVAAMPSADYSYSVSAGALPTGLALNAATGAITGTPQQSGNFNFTISAALGSCAGQRSYTVTVGCPAITLPALGNATIAASYTGSVAASPSGPYSYSVISGSLPGGLTLNTATGAITGTPTASGSFTFTIKAQTPSGCSATQNYPLAVGCPAITLSELATPQLNTAFNQTVTVTPNGGGYSFAVTAGALPAGLSLNSATGAVTGTVTAAGAYSFTITATRFGNCAGSRAYSGTIAGASCPAITLADLPNGAPGQMYNHSVTASPSGSYSYAVTSGSLPTGLTLYGSLGMLFGYPATAGSYNFTITATNGGNCTGSKQYSLTIGGAALQSLTFGDFDGDGKADLSVWRGQAGDWLTVASGDGQLKTETWGSSAAPYFDVMTPGDYDGDGRMDLAVFRRQTGQWLIKGSQDGAVTANVWGVATDVPVPGDYDGDGKTDIAVWRGAETNWYILRSSDGQTESISWGTSRAPYRDVPVAADFDGDGTTDVAVFRQSNGHWYIRLSSDGSTLDKAWGLGTDAPVAADYDGDGKADIAVWRGTDTNWYVLRSSDGAVQSISWGTSAAGDVPVPGDFDGDGKADVAVWRESDGRWYIQCSRDASVMTRTNGGRGDSPISSIRR